MWNYNELAIIWINPGSICWNYYCLLFCKWDAHKQTAQIPWINLLASWGMSAVAAIDIHTHTHTLTHPHTPVSRPPVFRGSHGVSGSAIQLRINVLQLNSAIPEQNERPKPSGEKSADNPHLKVLLGILCPCDHLLSLKEAVCISVCVCVGFRGPERELVCIPFISLLTDTFFCTEPEWPYTHNNPQITVRAHTSDFRRRKCVRGICAICCEFLCIRKRQKNI